MGVTDCISSPSQVCPECVSCEGEGQVECSVRRPAKANRTTSALLCATPPCSCLLLPDWNNSAINPTLYPVAATHRGASQDRYFDDGAGAFEACPGHGRGDDEGVPENERSGWSEYASVPFSTYMYVLQMAHTLVFGSVSPVLLPFAISSVVCLVVVA